MSFTFNGVSFREEFPGCEAIQSEYPNLSNLSVDSLEIPRMERRRFLETTRPNTSIEFYVILRGDTPEELEETRQRFMLAYDPTLGPGRLVLDEDPDWFWDMTLADEIVWERLTWECGRAGNSGGYRLAADVKFESFNDAAQRLLDEAWGPTEPPPPPEWVEVGRNLATDPGATNDLHVWSGWNGEGGNDDHDKAIVSADWSKSESAVRITRGTVVVDRGDVYLRTPEVGTIIAGATYTIVFSIRSLSDGQTFNAPIFSGKGYDFISKYPTDSFTLNAGDIQRVRYSFVASADTAASRRYLYLPWRDSFAGAQVELSMGDIYEGDYDPDREWFSGDYAPDGMRSEWLGEPNNSASVLYEQKASSGDDEDLPEVPSVRAEGNTRSWPTIQFTATATAAQEIQVEVGDFQVRVAGPFTAQDTAVLNYNLMRFELYREGVKVASLVPRMSTLDRLEIRPQDGWIPVTVEPVDGGTVSDVKVKPNSRKQ